MFQPSTKASRWKQRRKQMPKYRASVVSTIKSHKASHGTLTNHNRSVANVRLFSTPRNSKETHKIRKKTHVQLALSRRSVNAKRKAQKVRIHTANSAHSAQIEKEEVKKVQTNQRNKEKRITASLSRAVYVCNRKTAAQKDEIFIWNARPLSNQFTISNVTIERCCCRSHRLSTGQKFSSFRCSLRFEFSEISKVERERVKVIEKK